MCYCEISNPKRLITIEGVTQEDLVSQRITELDAHKLPVPSSLHEHPPVALRVGFICGLEREIRPDGIFACTKHIESKCLSYE